MPHKGLFSPTLLLDKRRAFCSYQTPERFLQVSGVGCMAAPRTYAIPEVDINLSTSSEIIFQAWASFAMSCKDHGIGYAAQRVTS